MGCTCGKQTASGGVAVNAKAVSAWGQKGSGAAGQQNIVVIGIDGSGKTSMVHVLVHRGGGGGAGGGGGGDAGSAELPLPPPPTAAPAASRANLGGCEVTLLDLPGRPTGRPQWAQFLPKADKVVFVVDSTDTLRAPVAKHVLWEQAGLIREHSLPLLVIVSKQDKSQDDGAAVMGVEEVRAQLDVDGLAESLPAACTVAGASLTRPEQLRETVANFVQSHQY